LPSTPDAPGVTCGYGWLGRPGYTDRSPRSGASPVHRVHTFVPPRRDARSLEAPTNGMDMEFRDDRRRGKFIIVLGLILAVAAGGAAFYLVNQAQSQAGQQDLQKVSIVVAVRAIPARQAIVADDVAIRE